MRERHARLYATDATYRARVAATSAKWSKEHPERVLEREQRRRALKLAAPVEPVSVARLIARDGLTCYLCLRALTRAEVTLDHVIPLSRGGRHAESNLRVACRSCNCRKGTRLLEELVA